MRVRIQHVTRHVYPHDAAFGPHVVRLRPAEHARARLLSYNLAVEPVPQIRWQYDPWGNRIAWLAFPVDLRARELKLTVDACFDIRPVNPFDFFVDDRCKTLPFDYPDGLQEELAPFLDSRSPGAEVKGFLDQLPPAATTVDWLVALNLRVKGHVNYVIREDPGIQTPEQTLTRAIGSCRDIALLTVALLRASGLAARFASGYLIQLADEGIIPDVAKGVQNDVVDLHAWAEVYLPGGGWLGLDGTSGLLCGEGHVPVACTVDPRLAAPVVGTTDTVAEGFECVMTVRRLGHEPRPRKPYSDEDWAQLLLAGDKADQALADQGVRLTMGGEPTWTSREFPNEPEWNTEALGPTKRAQGLRLASELRTRLGHGPLVLSRMGKLYPGESLPRWVLQLLWRNDGVPLWRDPTRLDLAPDAGSPSRALDDQLADARRLREALSDRLGVKSAWVTAFEDPWTFLMEEQSLPQDVDPLKANLDDSEERRRLARVLGRGLGRDVGYALPLARSTAGWATSPWTFRRSDLFLVPGDSPMGLRLPLDRLGGLPFEAPARDVTLGPAPLRFQTSDRQRHAEAAGGTSGSTGSPSYEVGPSTVVRSALCIEPRDGALHVFLPPMPDLESFIELVSAVEEGATSCDVKVIVEGYAPPSDPRVASCIVSPDPGVIEVNLPVSESFPEYVRLVETMADAANHSGLCTEKYQLDGREVGSGGGNHCTLGGPSTVESPFLIRPDLLGSLLRFAQNHPSLSYLFTGLFVGSTSQAPRVDEARHELLDELEIALARIPVPGGPQVPPWFVDRLLRNILVDVAGSTHRTEFCIDKLYNPASLAGRQGIVEMRAFEMPPHERMAVAQMLLMRSLTAAFCREPYEGNLVRWGTQLHDRFLLPHHLWADFKDVLRHLADSGLPLQESWYQPFLDHHFPIHGTYQVDDISLELRAALEPWTVLGEEPTGATVSRYVDSSMERLQVRVDGLTEGRHMVLVNGHALPMRPTGRSGESVAGVRFRAWQPAHCHHPHIPIHHPLRFDLVDTWARRSLGACTYHVWHPEGRAFDELPLTAFEAAARRAQRFTTEGHSPWPVVPAPAVPNPSQPYTLDLRRQG